MILSIPVPEHAKCLVKSGQTINIGTPIFEYSITSNISIPIATKLKIQPSNIFKYVKKFVGETIDKGEMVALKKGILSSTKIISEHTGIIKEIDHNEGVCIIEIENGSKKKDLSYIKGEITEVHKNEVQFKVAHAKEFELKSSSINFGGKALYLVEVKESSVTADCDNSICVSEKLTPYIQSKIEALGIHGFVTLNKLPEDTTLPNAIIKNIDDIKKIFDLNYSYCVINVKKSTIFFYQ